MEEFAAVKQSLIKEMSAEVAAMLQAMGPDIRRLGWFSSKMHQNVSADVKKAA
ncbi:MAG: hypothetical protein HQL80_11730 [Magnetococcales bacterium]|nr:hypothetical protein [Magnetococcales bacterium]